MDFKGLVNDYIIPNFITPIISLILAASIVFFLWNIFLVIKNADNEAELKKFKGKAVSGIIAIAVMVSMWGLVNFVTKSAKLDTTPINIPQLSN